MALFEGRAFGAPPGMVFGAEAACDDCGVCVDEEFGFVDGGAVEDKDASEGCVVTEGACDDEFAHLGEAAHVVHVALLDLGGFFFGMGVGFVTTVEKDHDVLFHDVGGVAFFHLELAGIVGSLGEEGVAGKGGEEKDDE